ncbi:MAG: IclR family transcriptional regulator, partial [Actinomycetota bacterium]
MGASRPSVLSKVAVILDVLAELGVAGVSELARETGLAKGTVFRLAAELVELGMVERAGDGYRLGSKLFELGSRVPGRRQFREAALPFLEDLSHATGQTVHLAVLDGTEVMYVERLVGDRSNEVPSAVASRLPLNCTATGKCLLAFGPPVLAESIFAHPLTALTASSITDADRLAGELEEVRVEGVAGEVVEVEAGNRTGGR